MAANQFLPFATDNTNVLTQAEYTADAQRTSGNIPGVARSKLVNKALRQSTLLSSAMAQFVANNQATDVVDSSSTSDIATQINNAILGFLNAKAPTSTVMTSSATWTRPAGCVRIRIRLQGGGGGGSSGTSVDGAAGRGGGGGAYVEAVISSPPSSASVIVGAAGAGAVPGSALQATDGGATTFTGGYSAGGGVAPVTMSALASGASSPGGLAAGGDVNVHGYASSGSIGSTSVPLSGKGADAYFGSGGQAIVSAGPGDNAIGYGAGGGGSVRGGGVNYNGGNGAPGVAIIEEFYV